jgi:hypothetical protein
MRGTSDLGTDASHLFERLEAERIALRQQFENLHHVLKEMARATTLSHRAPRLVRRDPVGG